MTSIADLGQTLASMAVGDGLTRWDVQQGLLPTDVTDDLNARLDKAVRESSSPEVMALKEKLGELTDYERQFINPRCPLESLQEIAAERERIYSVFTASLQEALNYIAAEQGTGNDAAKSITHLSSEELDYIQNNLDVPHPQLKTQIVAGRVASKANRDSEGEQTVGLGRFGELRTAALAADPSQVLNVWNWTKEANDRFMKGLVDTGATVKFWDFFSNTEKLIIKTGKTSSLFQESINGRTAHLRVPEEELSPDFKEQLKQIKEELKHLVNMKAGDKYYLHLSITADEISKLIDAKYTFHDISPSEPNVVTKMLRGYPAGSLPGGLSRKNKVAGMNQKRRNHAARGGDAQAQYEAESMSPSQREANEKLRLAKEEKRRKRAEEKKQPSPKKTR